MIIRKSKPSDICQQSFEAINFLLRIQKKYPFLKLKPESLLALMVSFEYNSVDAKTIRKTWPEDVCGYLQNIENNFKNSIKKQQANLLITMDREYDLDECIISTESRPGSVVYSECGGKTDLFERLYDIDWTEYFMNPVFPNIDDESVPEEIRQQAQEMVAEIEGSIGEAGPGSPGTGATGNKSSVSGLSQGFSISLAGISSGSVSFGSYTVPANWPTARQVNAFASLHMYLPDGSGSMFEWVDPANRAPPAQTQGKSFVGQTTKTLSNIYNGYRSWKPPPKGTKVEFVMVSVDGTKRTNFVSATWAG